MIERIKAVSGAIVDLTNVVGWSMLPTSGYAYNFNANPTFTFDYLHDITTGYAKFDNCTFWKGISCCSLFNNVSNLTATNTLFKGKYFYVNGPRLAIMGPVTSDIFFKLGTAVTANNVYFSNISSEEAVTLSGNYNNFNFDNSYIAKELDILRSNFSNSKISNISFSPNSSLDAMFLSGNTNLPEFENILIPGRKTGLTKADSCSIQLNGLSCLSSYYYSFSARDLTGELRNILYKDSTYGAYDMTFKSTTAPLFINGLTAIRASNDILSGINNIGTSVRSLCSPFSSGTSLLLSSIAARVNTPLPKVLTNNDDLTIETWYLPVSSELAGNQSLITIWDQLSTTAADKGCVLGVFINTAGRIVVNKGSVADGTPTNIITTTLPYDLINTKWYHVALTKISNRYTCYINGKIAGTTTNATELFQPSNPNVYIGAKPITRTTFGESLSGYVAGAKISYGAKYRDEFIPPTTPFLTEVGTMFNLTTAFSAQYSNMPLSFIDIEDNKTSYPLTFSKLKFLANNTLSSSLIDVSNSTYETFTINDSDLSTYGSPLITNSNNDYIIGSYIFTKCNFINPPINATTILGYQPYTYRESGFAVQYANGDINNNYRWTRGGKVSLDSSAAFEGRSTEKLESISDDFVLKSNLKLIPVSEGSLVKGIKLTYKTPVTYLSGGSLKIEKNTILGINNDSILSQLAPTNDAWTTVTVSLSDYNNPFWNQKSYIQAYVELTGANNQLHIAKWQTSNI